MEYTRNNDTIYFRVDKGEEVIEEITKICEEEKIISGTIQGIGASQEVILRYLVQEEKKFLQKELTEGMEITSFLGNITQNQGNPYLHCHITLADSTFNSHAGHCHKVVVGATFEGTIRIDQIEVYRQFSQEIGLNLFEFEN